jgi:hypothetical protein
MLPLEVRKYLFDIAQACANASISSVISRPYALPDGPARKCQGLPFCGGAKKLRSSFCFLGEPQTRRVAVSGRTKQKPAVPPARRRLSHLALPAR